MIDVLRQLDLFEGVDDEVLEEFARSGSERRLEVGQTLLVEGEVTDLLWVIAEGRIEWSRHINGSDVELGERGAPSYAGASNILTGDPAVATGRASSPVLAYVWEADTLRSFLRAQPAVMRTVIRLIAPVAQAAESALRQQEKLAALGTLSAGLAHELNNPAAAARRTATALDAALATLEDTVNQFVSSGVEREDAATLVSLQRQALDRAAAGAASGSAVEAADREDELAALLDQMGYDGWRLAEPLARASVDQPWLDAVSAAAGAAAGAALEWVAASLTAHSLVGELHESTARISSLVGAVKDYTHMDRASIEEVDVHDGIESTLTILGYRLKHGNITVERRYDRSLPRVTVHGSELNQVWTNLIVNALDALDGQGTITITTRPAPIGLAVEIADDGPGVPEEVRSRVFEPFFTTKPVGQGTGLGLDIARRIVLAHRGDVTLRSRPGSTEFVVTLPIGAAVAAAGEA
jgi:signal transduction histidine kinase